MKKIARLDATKNRAVKIKTGLGDGVRDGQRDGQRSRITQRLTPRQITALIVVIDEAQIAFKEGLELGLQGVPPREARDYLAQQAQMLRNFKQKSPDCDLTLRLTPDEHFAYFYICMLGTLANSPPAQSASQVQTEIQLEIFDQLLQLLPEPIRQTILDDVQENMERLERRGKLRLLPTPP